MFVEHQGRANVGDYLYSDTTPLFGLFDLRACNGDFQEVKGMHARTAWNLYI